MGKQLQAVDLGHGYVGDQDVEPLASQNLLCVLGI